MAVYSSAMDEIDHAQEYALLYQADALMRHSRFGLGHDASSCTGQIGPRSCVDCGKKIPKARLEINPRAIRCVACQRVYEIGT